MHYIVEVSLKVFSFHNVNKLKKPSRFIVLSLLNNRVSFVPHDHDHVNAEAINLYFQRRPHYNLFIIIVLRKKMILEINSS